MSKYTLRGSAELDAKIDADLRRIAEVVQPCSLAGILLGGYGRGEGTPQILPDGSQRPYNDYDLIVLVETVNRSVAQNIQTLERQLTTELRFQVDLHPYAAASLPRREFSLFNYELKYGHRVIWGDPDRLVPLPAYPHNAIPLSEGSRLLLNRGKLLLDIQQRLAQPEPLTEEERHRFIKFLFKVRLAFGDCALLAAGHYTLAYDVKKEHTASFPDNPDRDVLIEGYLRAIAFKEWADFQSLEPFDIEKEFNTVRAVFLRFFPWYRSLYSNRECSVPKAIALNLKWNKRIDSTPPRERLYDTILALLKGQAGISADRFRPLQRRFS